MRGLTHRAVDRTAGLPEGSTSYYFRTREALLTATVQRLAEVDAADVAAAVGLDAGSDLDLLAEAIAGTLEHWLTVGRERMLARYELALESTRRPYLRTALIDGGGGFRDGIEALLASLGAVDPARQGHDLVACLDGLIFDQVAGAGERDFQPSRTVRGLLRGILGR